MTAFALQHVPFEDPGAITDWFSARGRLLRPVPLYDGAPLPPLAEVTELVVMGGPMSVNDEAVVPWMAAEKRFLKAAIDRGVPVLGVCLGAQLIADVSGAKVTRNPEREIGWLPVRFARRERLPSWALALPEELTVFHWHGETFALPPGAVPLASSPGCANQGFVLEGKSVVALQFHLEATTDQMARFEPHLNEEIQGRGPERWVQEPAAIVAGAARHQAAAHLALDRVLTGIFGAP